MTNRQRIGVFDSGVGGRSVADAIRTALPSHSVVYVDDSANIPYGSKDAETLYQLVLPILRRLAEQVDVIVIACNTVSTLLAPKLRQQISVPIIALEPMVKPAAAMTSSSVIAVCATPSTLASDRYARLTSEFASDITVIEPDCSDWAAMIQANDVNQHRIVEQIEAALAKGADVIVLGCTHYHWIQSLISDIVADRAMVIQPEQAIIAQVRRVIGQLAETDCRDQRSL